LQRGSLLETAAVLSAKELADLGSGAAATFSKSFIVDPITMNLFELLETLSCLRVWSFCVEPTRDLE